MFLTLVQHLVNLRRLRYHARNFVFLMLLISVVQLTVIPRLCAQVEDHDTFVLDPSIFDQASVEQERLGKVYLSDLFLSPRFDYTEPKSGSFLLGNSYVAADWTRGELISGHFAYGTKSLIGVPSRYGVVNGEEFAIIEGYVQIESEWGRFRLGLQPIPFGLESGINEANLRFERSLLYQRGTMGIRDIGLGYSVSSAGFFNDWLVHNGEGGDDLDSQMWFTTRIGYHKKFFTGGVSAQTGQTNPLSTDPNGNLISTPGGSLQATGINIDEGAKYRYFNLFFAYRSKDLETGFEVTTGDVFQSQFSSHPNTGHFDVFLPFKESWGALFRYDYYDPKDGSDPTNQQYTIGACYRSRYETSSVYLYGSLVVMPAPLNDVHQILLVWRVSPFAQKYN